MAKRRNWRQAWGKKRARLEKALEVPICGVCPIGRPGIADTRCFHCTRWVCAEHLIADGLCGECGGLGVINWVGLKTLAFESWRSLKLWWQELPWAPQRWAAAWLRSRDWVVFWLPPEARRCNRVCWMQIYQQAETQRRWAKMSEAERFHAKLVQNDLHVPHPCQCQTKTKKARTRREEWGENAVLAAICEAFDNAEAKAIDPLPSAVVGNHLRRQK